MLKVDLADLLHAAGEERVADGAVNMMATRTAYCEGFRVCFTLLSLYGCWAGPSYTWVSKC